MSKARNLSLLSAVEAGATTDQTKADLNAIGVSGGRKNLIINGGMTISQRGDFTASAAAANGSFYVDRFKAVLSAVAGDKQHTTVTIGGVTKRAFKITATSAATGTVQIKQGVELSGIEVGETYTISCWMKSNHADARLRNNYIGGTSSDSPTSHTGGGAWEKITWTVDSTSTTADILVYATIYDGANVAIAVGDYIEITDLQMEKGSVATDFEHRSFGEELALCQRYFYRYQGATQEQIYNENNGATAKWWFLTFPQMRATPSATFSSGWVGGSIVVIGGTINSMSVGGASPTAISFRVHNSGAGGTVKSLYHTDSFSGDYCYLSAEL